MSQNQCPGCFSPFARGQKLVNNDITVYLNYCPVCGDYMQRRICVDALSVPFVEIVKTHRFREVANG